MPPKLLREIRGRQLCELLPAADLLVIEGAGHATHEDQPDEVNFSINNFLIGRQVGGACDEG